MQVRMRVSVNEVSGDHSDIGSLLKPFVGQSASIRSIVAVGCRAFLKKNSKQLPVGLAVDSGQEAILLQLPSGECMSVIADSTGRNVLDGLARAAHKHCEPNSGDDLLMLPASAFKEWMPPPDSDFNFRAVVALFEHPGQIDNSDWKLRRTLFDRGLICIGAVPFPGWKALCFLAGDAVECLNKLAVEPRGYISMSVLLLDVGFANQLFRYATVKFYALRHGLTPAFPPWEGNRLFGLEDKSCEGLDLPQVGYPGFAENDREIWEQDESLINIDLAG